MENLSCGLDECTTVCPGNITSFQENYDCEDAALTEGFVTLKFLTGSFGVFFETSARRFKEQRKDVEIEIVASSMQNLAPNIINEATSKTGLFDGFLAPPTVMGSIVEEDGWADLKPFIEETAARTQAWSDILVAYRKTISQFQDRILMYPLDGDVLSMFYRKDVLKHFGLEVPRTWDEYNAVAKVVHGQEFRNKTLTGSCVGRTMGCAGAYWANLVLSSITQTSGTSSGHLFDTKDMKPLLGEALIQSLEWMEGQAQFGPPDEFSGCVDINQRINEGTCVLTYDWGNTFKTHLSEGGVFREPGYEMGVARTPGSPQVLDRDQMKLVPCDAERCRYGKYYDDIGWVNHAPYLAFGGWSCAVNNYTTPGKKRLAMEFCEFAASEMESLRRVVPNATIAGDGSDPFRSSHLEFDQWISQGYEPVSLQEYLTDIQESLTSENCVSDIRFPTSPRLYDVLDIEYHDYLYEAVHGPELSAEMRREKRKLVCDRLTDSWRETIAEYDGQVNSRSSALQQYQRLRNVYTDEVELNELGNGIIVYGWTMAAFILIASLGCGMWAYGNRSLPIVRTSQPFFLILIAMGVFVFGSSIIPMAVDDGHFSARACDMSCMAVPWLAVMGWSILFSALYAKIRRVNIVVHNVLTFKAGVKVSERDVMTPFALLFTANLVLLLVWTLVDPLFWERRVISKLESYGTCTANSDSNTWKVILSLLATLNGACLVGANIEAWKARKIDTEYGESSYIGLIMASILQVFLVGVPLGFLVQDNPTARFFVTSSMAFIVSTSSLLLLFLPKIINLYDKKKTAGSQTDTLKSGNQNLKESAAMIHDFRARVKSLQHILEEAGIDGKIYIQEAGLDVVGKAEKRHIRDFSSISNEMESIGAMYSLPPVPEEEEEDSNELILSTPTPEQYSTHTITGSPKAPSASISRWLEKRRLVPSPSITAGACGKDDDAETSDSTSSDHKVDSDGDSDKSGFLIGRKYDMNGNANETFNDKLFQAMKSADDCPQIP